MKISEERFKREKLRQAQLQLAADFDSLFARLRASTRQVPGSDMHDRMQTVASLERQVAIVLESNFRDVEVGNAGY